MSDIFLKDFYRRASDESWPTIENYSDFLQLPEHIRQECLQQHEMDARLEQIENCQYWRNILTKVYRYKNLAYLPVPKCASSYYTNLFCNQLGWEECNFLDLAPGTVCFGLFDDPVTRYLKGITEWLWMQVVPTVDNIFQIPTSILKTIIVGDHHSLPYTTTFGTILDKINCIPMTNQSDLQIKQTMMKLFNLTNHNIKLPINDPKKNQSPDTKIQLYNLVKDNFEKSLNGSVDEFVGRAECTYILLSSDLKFYHNLLHTFDPNWKTIKTI